MVTKTAVDDDPQLFFVVSAPGCAGFYLCTDFGQRTKLSSLPLEGKVDFRRRRKDGGILCEAQQTARLAVTWENGNAILKGRQTQKTASAV